MLGVFRHGEEMPVDPGPALGLVFSTLASAQGLPTASPEDVGLSSSIAD
jgi:hypothetical protein